MVSKNKIREVVEEVLAEIRPSDNEKKEVNERINEIVRKINKNLKDGKAVLGGSGAKDTWLKGGYDADIFVKFNYKRFSDKSGELSEKLEKVLKKSFKITRFHGSRDYFQIKKKGFTYEIVPILAINKASDAKNITDVSILHTNYVKRFGKLKDEIRLLKKFCKGQSVYGAESHINGFSGYVTEILTIYYNGFLGAIRAISRWKGQVVIDPEEHYKNKEEILRGLNQAKLEGPLVLIDPVDMARNAAAAVDERKFVEFINAARRFLKNPNSSFFEEKKMTIEEIKKKNKEKNLVVIKVKGRLSKPDITGTKILKVYEFLEKKLDGFKVVKKGWYFNNKQDGILWYVFGKDKLDKVEIVSGPPLKMEKFVKDFKKKYKKTVRKKGRIYGYRKRKYTRLRDHVKALLKEKYVKERVKKTGLIQ